MTQNDMMVNNSIKSGIKNSLELSDSRGRDSYSGNFDEVLNSSSRNFSVEQQNRRDKNQSDTAQNAGIQIGFATNNPQVTARESNKMSTVGGRKTSDAISTKQHNEHHKTDSDNAVSSWEKAKELKNNATRCTPGMGSESEEKVKVSTRLAAKGMVFNGRSAGLRADGTPTMTDDKGNIRVLNAKNPDMSIADLIKNQSVDDEKVEVFKHQMAEQKAKDHNAPKTTGDSYIAQSENVKEKITEKLGKTAKDKVGATEFANREVESETKTETARPVSDAKSAARYADKKPQTAETSTHQETLKTEQKLENEIQEKKTRLIFAQNDKESSKASAISALGKKTVTSAETAQNLGTPQLSMEAAQFAASLKGNNHVQSAKHLADLLGARMEFIAQNAKPTVNINLNPRQLGDIQIKLIANGENNVARIHADKESVGKALEIAAPQLAQQLQKVGFQVETVMVDYGEMSFDQQQFSQANEGNGDSPFDELFGQSLESGEADSIQATGTKKISTHDGEIDVVA